MLYKTRGIALSYIKYKESSIIARIFTEAFGMQSYIINGIRSKSAKSKIALFQPLTSLDLVVYHHKKKEINRISELKCSFNYHTIPYNIKKTSIALFLTELISQALRDEEENEQLFDFLLESIITFDGMTEGYENFHIQFMLKLSKYLGIQPESAVGMLKEVGHSKVFDTKFAETVDFFMRSGYADHQNLGKGTRNEILLLVINYFRFHYDSIREFKSIQVLKEVLG